MTSKLLGRVKGSAYGYNKPMDLEIEIKLKPVTEGLELSITAGLWMPNHYDIVQGGQMEDTIKEMLQKKEFVKLNTTQKKLQTLLDIWEKWHLNGMNAGCEHQRGLIKLFNLTGGDLDYSNLIKNPAFKKCPHCGYAYGSKWLFVALPGVVVAFVEKFNKSLPDFETFKTVYEDDGQPDEAKEFEDLEGPELPSED